MKNNNALSNGVIGNAAQMDAIRHHKGPAMVIAGPGSGKTFVIVQRLRYLIEEMHEDPSRILVITFTKAAAIEMQQRFYKLTDSSYPEVNFGTFHSVFYQIIRQNKSGNQNYSIADDCFKIRLIRDILHEAEISEILKKEGCETRDISDSDISDILTDISRVKNTGEDINTVKVSNLCKAAFKDIFILYNNRLREFGKIDFDDMICKCLELLRNDSEILSFYQNKFSFYLVDEYQDINSMQFQILKLLSKPHGNVFVVGDDDQSIYGFRGSDPGIMLSFEESFREYSPRKIVLKQNYRCAKKIIENACLLIDENKIRYKKDICPGEKNEDGYVITRRFRDKSAQYKAIASYLGSGNVDPSRVAVIYRTNSEALSLASCLKEYGIMTNLDSFSRSYVEDEAVKLVISYLSFAYLGQKRADYLKIINKPMRFISRETALDDIISEKKVLAYYRGNSSKTKDVKKFFIQINMISHLRPYLAVRYIRRDIGIDKLYPGSKEAMDNLLERARGYEYAEDFIRDINEELENIKSTKSIRKGGNNKSCVKLLTMHGSKGLEFDIVWLPDLNEGIIPSRSAETQQQIEEERRMLYVGMTRAKTALIMSYVAGEEDNPMLPSRFLRPIRLLWEKKENDHSSPSKPSSGSSMISSNSTSSR